MNIDLSKYNQDGYSRGRNSITVLLWWIGQGTLFRFSIHNMYKWRNFLLKMFGAKVGNGVKIRPTAYFTYPWKVSIGENSWIGDHVKLYSLDEIIIGSNCVISQECYLCTGSHNLTDPHFGLMTQPIHIGDGAWIATDVFIYPGVTVSELAVVAARSTVLKDVNYNEVHAGSPAKFIKNRFEMNFDRKQAN